MTLKFNNIQNQVFKANANYLKNNSIFGNEKYKIIGSSMEVSMKKNGNSFVLNFFDKSTNTGFSVTKDQGFDIQMTTIQTKLYSGQELSPAELAYLKETSPDLYEKAVKIAQERKEFEKKLNRCKSKEEAAALKLSKNMEIVKSVKDGKGEQGDFALMRMSAIEREYIEFTQTQKYKNLPDKDEYKFKNLKDEKTEKDKNYVDKYV